MGCILCGGVHAPPWGGGNFCSHGGPHCRAGCGCALACNCVCVFVFVCVCVSQKSNAALRVNSLMIGLGLGLHSYIRQRGQLSYRKKKGL